MAHRASIACLLLSLVGCSSQVLQTSNSSGSGGSGAGAGGSLAQGGVGGTSGFCPVLAEDAVDWKIEFPTGVTLTRAVSIDVPLGTKEDLSDDGEVVAITPGHLTIDTCPPSADCAGTLVDLTVAPESSPFDLGIPLHTFVHFHLVSEVVGYPPAQAPYRTLFLQIDNLPTWGGVPNPIDVGSELWFMAGVDFAPGDMPAGSLGVQYDTICESTSMTYYQAGSLTFWDLAAPQSKLTLQQGQTQVLPSRPLTIRNVDSTIDRIEGAWEPELLVKRAPILD
ncbi:MAG: hypothetical protein ABJE95_20520 [Byssovorax sp.]